MNMGKSNIFQNINAGRIFKISITSSLVIIYIILWARMISTPSLRTRADFIAFYAVGRIAQEYGYSAAYQIDLQHTIEQTVVGFNLAKDQVLLYNHVPYLIPLLKHLIGNNYISSFARWAVAMLGIYIAGSVLFLNSLFPTKKNKIYGTLLIGMLTFYPFFVSFLLGQDTALLFLGTAFWCVGVLKKNVWLAATGLSLTTIRPHICLTLAIPLFFTYRKVFWRFLIIAGFLALISILMLGKGGAFGFINLLIISAKGTWYGMSESAMLNLTGLLLRTIPFIEPGLIHIISWVGYLAGICLVSILWIRAKEFDNRLLGLSIIIALFFAPHLHYHDLTLLIIPLVFAVMLPALSISSERLALAPLGTSLLMMLEPIHFIFPYVLYAGLSWWLTRNPRPD